MEEEEEKRVDMQLWHACAGSMVKIPTVNSTVIYFPQGHVENAQIATTINFSGRRFPPQILCRVELVKFLANPDTNEVYTKIRLIPVDFKDAGVLESASRSSENPGYSSFVKTLSPSDSNQVSFSVPRSGAERIFPPLDYKTNMPNQILLVKDIHGETWSFRHAYRGSPKRHLLTTGWSTFVRKKSLLAGDSILFLKSENGDFFIGIRRAQRDAVGFVSKLSALYKRVNENALKIMEGLKEKAEAVMQALVLATSGQVFEVDYYPRPNTSGFCVEEAVVRAAMEIPWRRGMWFRMAFESEDSQRRISRRTGIISNIQAADPQWPNSSWNLFQVTWDMPNLVPRPNKVNPWAVKLVLLGTPAIELSALSPSKKKPRVLPYELLLDAKFPVPSLSENNHHPLGILARIRRKNPTIKELKHISLLSLAKRLVSNSKCLRATKGR